MDSMEDAGPSNRQLNPSSSQLAFTRSSTSVSQDALCWVCYCSDADSPTPQKWVHPCRCCGSSKWVHQSCLQEWINERQHGNPNTAVNCSACGYEYAIVYPPPDAMLLFFDSVDRVCDLTCSYFFGGLIVGCLYWAAVTYGAMTVMQIYGHHSGLEAMERTDPVFLLVGLPVIPISLIIGKLVRWQDFFLRLWRRHLRNLSLFNFMLPSDIPVSRLLEANDYQSYLEIGSIPRVICGALSLPTFSVFFGRLFFGRIKSNLLQAVSGGFFYLSISGLFGMYHREIKFIRSCRRQVLDYTSS